MDMTDSPQIIARSPQTTCIIIKGGCIFDLTMPLRKQHRNNMILNLGLFLGVVVMVVALICMVINALK